MKIILTILFFIFVWPALPSIRAVEGMRLPQRIYSYFEELSEAGIKMHPEQIYSDSTPSIKDAIVKFGYGCSGAIISEKGLIITNYHCALKYFHSVNCDYEDVYNGFQASSMNEELPVSGLSVKILRESVDITQLVLSNSNKSKNEYEVNDIINRNIRMLKDSVSKQTDNLVEIASYNFGSSYYLMKYEEYKDIRLVLVPPGSLGEFGGKKDNWTWPRHTADFALFRIYTDSTNSINGYDKDNIPLGTDNFLKININGVNYGDFTMVYGFPGKSYNNITSYGLEHIFSYYLPAKLKLKESKQQVLEEEIRRNDNLVRKYHPEAYSLANVSKKYRGMLAGFDEFEVIEKKIQKELFFKKLSYKNDTVTSVSNILEEIRKFHDDFSEYILAEIYWKESFLAIELFDYLIDYYLLLTGYENHSDKTLKKRIEKLKIKTKEFYKGYYPDTDKKVFANVMNIFREDVKEEYKPLALKQIPSRFKYDFKEYADYLYSNTIFSDSVKVLKLLNNFTERSIRKIEKDEAYNFMLSFIETYRNQLFSMIEEKEIQLQFLYNKYIKILTQHGVKIIPDANATLRLSYGYVEGYEPKDGIYYDYFTTFRGLIEKNKRDSNHYKLPSKIRSLYKRGEFNAYGVDSLLPVCFIASNQTSGGNSGGPVLNANGEIIGINFDRNWEGTISDYYFSPEFCRNIVADIRYILFIIDEYMNAERIINEIKNSNNVLL